MNVYKPEVAELLLLVEERYNKSLNTTTDFDEFSLFLKREGVGKLSTSTLKRLWGYVNDEHKPRLQTLDLLARYLDYDNFDAFCSWLKSTSAYNSSFLDIKQIQSSDLQPGEQIEIGWSPNRYVRLLYCGQSQFKVVEVRQSKLHVGDCFETFSFFLGEPLSLPYILREGKRTPPFVAGRNSGLTLLSKVYDRR